jgi:hypothetical protein
LRAVGTCTAEDGYCSKLRKARLCVNRARQAHWRPLHRRNHGTGRIQEYENLRVAAVPENGAKITRIGMTTFDKREEGFEQQFAHDEALKFKATARRNKLVGLWAAEKLGLTGAEAEAYAAAIVVADLESSGDYDLFRKIRADFDAKGVVVSDHQIRRTMDELTARAITQIKASG